MRANVAACSERCSAELDSTLNQLYEGMTFLYGGMASGIVYELLAVFRRHSDRRLVTGICDALFLLFALPCVALCFFVANGGELRLYGFLIMLMGGLAARWAFQPLLRMI